MNHPSTVRPDTSSARQRLALPGLLVLGAALRLLRLGHQPLWLDEAYTWLSLDVFRGGGLPALADFDHIGPGYYLLAIATDALGIHGPWGLRLPSAVAGTVAIWLVHRLVRAITGNQCVALGAALFITLSPMAVWYSQEARGYSLLLALSTWYLLTMWRQVQRVTTAGLATIVVQVGLLMWVHQFAVFVFAAMAVFAVLQLRRWRPVLQLAAAHVVGLLLFVPFLVLSWNRLSQQVEAGPQTIVTRIPYNVLTMLAGQTYGPSNLEIRGQGIGWAIKHNLPALALFGVAMAVVAVALWRARGVFSTVQAQWLACIFLVPNVALVAATLVTHNLYHARYLITLLPAVAWLFGELVARVRVDKVALSAVVLSLLVMVWSLVGHFTNAKYGKEDYSQAPGVIKTEVGPGDALLLGNRLAIPSMWNHGFRCPTDHANVLGADALDSLGTLPVDRAAGHDTFTLETRQWETVPAWQLDAKLDELLGKPVKTWTWSGVTLTQRHGALQLKEMPGMDEHCDGR